MRAFYSVVLIAGLGLGAIGVIGCDSNPPNAAPADSHDADHQAQADDDQSHGGWWCVEHGVPEGECALCDTSLVAAFKEQGDWCEEHHRPESQCFKCDPDRLAKFAARYEAKFGEQPPAPTE
jgi:hypothetical protein